MVRAATFTWANTGTGNWDLGTNWDQGGALPGANDNAQVSNGGTVQITSLTPLASIFYLGYAAGQSGNAVVSTGGLLTTSIDVQVGAAGTGNMTLDGGSVQSRRVIAAAQQGAAGTITISNGGQWTTTELAQVGLAGTGTLTVTGTGSLVSIGTEVRVGDQSTGNGTLQVLAAGALTVGGRLYVGNQGSGMLLVDNASVSSESGALGNYASGTGHATVQNNGQWTMTGPLYVGNNGGGTLDITSGGTVQSTGGYIGYTNTSTGAVTISDGRWTNNDSLRVGQAGTGSLTVNSGGSVSNTDAYLAYLPGSTGNVTVNAGGSWTSTGTLNVGHNGTGTLTLNGNAQVTSARGSVGEGGGATGTALLHDTSMWTVGGDMFVGASGQGTLTADGSATLSSTNGYLGSVNASANGSATFSGNSRWINTGEIRVGNAGTGALTINDAASVTTSGLTVAFGPRSAAGSLTLNGGVLTTGYVAGGPGNPAFAFNGGVLRATQSTTAFLTGFPNVTLGGTATIDSNGFDITASSPMSGAGSLTKVGNGTLTLTGNNTYTGLTTLSAGTLQIGEGGTSGSVAGDIANAGSLVFNRADTLTLGGAISGTGAVTQAGTGMTVLTGNSTYTGGTRIASGTLQLGNGGTSGSISGDVTNDGTFAFNRSDTLVFGGTISGTGGVQQSGTGTTILNAANTYTGPTTISVGALAVGDSTHSSARLSGGEGVKVLAGATLGGYGSVAGNVVNDGTIAVANALPALQSGGIGTLTLNGNLDNGGRLNLAGNRPGNVLLVNGNYSARPGASIVLSALLNKGGPLANQTTDRLLVFGDPATPTTIAVLPAAGSTYDFTGEITKIGASDGISIVQVAGASTADAFQLAGGYVVARNSPFEYKLHAYGPGSPNGLADASQSLVGNAGNQWDYRLQRAYQGDRDAVAPQVASYLSAPVALLQSGIDDLDSLHRRLGEIRDDQTPGRASGQGEGFVRLYGGNYSYSTQRSAHDFGYDFTGDYSAVQFGGNVFARRGEAGTLRFGGAFTFGSLHLNPNSVDGASNTRVGTYRLSAYGTYQSALGWYVDGTASVGWFNGDVTTTARGQAMDLKGTSYAASLEAGMPFPVGGGFDVEPQLQLIGQHIAFRNTVDVDSLDVNIGSQNQLTGRAGVRLLRPIEFSSGRLTPYLGANLIHSFVDGANLQVGDVQFVSGKLGSAWEVSAGVNGNPNARMSLYGRVAYRHSLGSAGVSGWLLNGGVRYVF